MAFSRQKLVWELDQCRYHYHLEQERSYFFLFFVSSSSSSLCFLLGLHCSGGGSFHPNLLCHFLFVWCHQAKENVKHISWKHRFFKDVFRENIDEKWTTYRTLDASCFSQLSLSLGSSNINFFFFFFLFFVTSLTRGIACNVNQMSLLLIIYKY